MRAKCQASLALAKVAMLQANLWLAWVSIGDCREGEIASGFRSVLENFLRYT